MQQIEEIQCLHICKIQIISQLEDETTNTFYEYLVKKCKETSTMKEFQEGYLCWAQLLSPFAISCRHVPMSY